MNHNSAFENPKPLTEIFGGFPALDAITLFGISLYCDGPRVELRFDLPELPRVMPPKWVAAKANRVQVLASFYGLRNYTCKGWSTENVVRLEIGSRDGTRTLEVVGNALRVEAIFDFATIDKVSGYRLG